MYPPAGYTEEEPEDLCTYTADEPLLPQPPPHVPKPIWTPRQGLLSTPTGQPLKRKLNDMIQNPSKRPVVACGSDSDFDDDPGPVKKVASAPAKPAKPSTPACKKPTPRLQACGEKQLDRCITAARDNGARVRVVVVSMSYRIKVGAGAGADQVWRAEARDGAAYDVCPPHNRDQVDVGESEFMGLFCSDVCAPGLGDQIADQVLGDAHTHVVVVDPSPKGDNFARLAACVAALKVKHRDATVGAALYKQLTKPKDDKLRAALIKASRCKSDTLMRAAMREHYHEHL